MQTSFGRQLLQVKPPTRQVIRKRVEYFLCALLWAAVGVFLIINPFVDERGIGSLIGAGVMALLTILCLWGAFRRIYNTTLTLYEFGFTIAMSGSEVEGFGFRDIVGTRSIRKRLFMSASRYRADPDTTLVHNNPTIDRLNQPVEYIETDTFVRRTKPEGNALTRFNKSWSQFISVEVDMKNDAEIPLGDLYDGLADVQMERFFTALDEAFSNYLLRDIRREGLNHVSMSFGEELELERGQLIFNPALRERKRGRKKQQETTERTITMPLDSVWSIRAPRPEDITETSMLKLMGVPDERGHADELIVMFLNLALNIDVLYAIVKMNRENRGNPA